MDKVNSALRSRRFWAAVAGVVIVLGKPVIPLLGSVSDEQIVNVVLMLGAWIVGDSLRESK